jgi:hypothetical protein
MSPTTSGADCTTRREGPIRLISATTAPATAFSVSFTTAFDRRTSHAEREYKIAAKSKLDLTVPLVDAATGSGFGKAVLSIFNATNLLSPFEKMRLRDVLRGPPADAFVRAAARFATGEKTALHDLEHLLRPFDSAKWTVVTYLPFLWRPEAHMFLEPEVTKDFAARVGHRFATDYEAHLDPQIYDCLLDLTAQTLGELADLEPRDGIDVQGFIWVVGAYQEEAAPPVP